MNERGDKTRTENLNEVITLAPDKFDHNGQLGCSSAWLALGKKKGWIRQKMNFCWKRCVDEVSGKRKKKEGVCLGKIEEQSEQNLIFARRKEQKIVTKYDPKSIILIKN